jgi:hypothetical protein
MQTVKTALLQAIAANHTTAVIHAHVFEINTRSLTVTRTFSAFLTLILVETNLQPRKAGKETQDGSHRTDCIAIGTAIAP